VLVVVPLETVVEDEGLQQEGLARLLLVDYRLLGQLEDFVPQVVLQLVESSRGILIESVSDRVLASVAEPLVDLFVPLTLDIEEFDEFEGFLLAVAPFLVPRVQLVVPEVERTIRNHNIVFLVESVGDDFPLEVVGLSHFLNEGVQLSL
jgi:hypothetical protein